MAPSFCVWVLGFERPKAPRWEVGTLSAARSQERPARSCRLSRSAGLPLALGLRVGPPSSLALPRPLPGPSDWPDWPLGVPARPSHPLAPPHTWGQPAVARVSFM